MTVPGNGWTNERIAALTKLWHDGLSCSQIAKQLGGITRNAVIGKVNRLGLSGRCAPTKPTLKRREPPKAPRPIRAAAPTPDHGRVERQRVVSEAAAKGERVGGFLPAKPVAVPARANPTPLMELTTLSCRWPLDAPGVGGETMFCGAIFVTAPYCCDHRRVAWQPTPPGAKKRSPAELAHGLRKYLA